MNACDTFAFTFACQTFFFSVGENDEMKKEILKSELGDLKINLIFRTLKVKATWLFTQMYTKKNGLF